MFDLERRHSNVCVCVCVCPSERRCCHDVQQVALSELKRCQPGHFHHVRARLKSYEPRRLHQALKLYCRKCSTM